MSSHPSPKRLQNQGGSIGIKVCTRSVASRSLKILVPHWGTLLVSVSDLGKPLNFTPLSRQVVESFLFFLYWGPNCAPVSCCCMGPLQ